MRSERALPALCPTSTPLQTQSKMGSCQCEKPICVQKQNISSNNNGLNHSVITSHAKQDLIKGATISRSSLSIGKQDGWGWGGGAEMMGGIKSSNLKRIPLLWKGRIHFARWFAFKSAGTNPWHEVILCWSFSPKFIHQLFTVNADCISVGNYKGWVFSLRQKECDTADTTHLMCWTQCPRIVQGKNYLCIRKQCAGAKEKGRHIILNLS